MDNLTHTLVGVGIANAGLAKRFGKGTTLTLAVASNLPDVDALYRLAGDPTYFALHRTFTHSILGLPVIAAATALLVRRWAKEIPPATLFGLALAGSALHVLFDLMNSFGVVLLYPVSGTRFEWAWLFILDPALLIILAAPLVLARWINLTRASRACLALAAVYVAMCGLGRLRAQHILDGIPPARPEFSYVFPEPFGPSLFRGVVREGAEYRVYKIYPVPGAYEILGTHLNQERDPSVEALRSRGVTRPLETMFLAPVWTPVPPDECEVYDLRFDSSVISRRRAFTFRFKPSGEIIRGP